MEYLQGRLALDASGQKPEPAFCHRAARRVKSRADIIEAEIEFPS